MFAINLGGEGEIPGVLNQQPMGSAKANWMAGSKKSLVELIADGHQFMICPNEALALPNGCVDVVYTNHVPVDKNSTLGLGVQTSEVERILKSGGEWIRDGVPFFKKP